MNIQSDLPNHDDSFFYKKMEAKAKAWNALGKELSIKFDGGYDHYHCTFSAQLTVPKGTLKIYGHREYVNVPNPATTDRFSEVLKIDMELNLPSTDSVKTFNSGFFGDLQLKKSGMTSTTDYEGKRFGFSSESLKSQITAFGLFTLSSIQRITIQSRSIHVSSLKLYSLDNEMEILKSFIGHISGK